MSQHIPASKLRDIARTLLPKDRVVLLDALEFAEKIHAGQTRKSGEEFIIHPTSVALNLWEKYGDLELTAAGLLHDTIEDSEEVERQDIYDRFGPVIGFLVDAVTKTLYDFYLHPETTFDDKIERLLWAGMQDMRCLLLKIADREHNITTLVHLKNHKQVRMAFETQAIFQPLKNILRIDEKMALKVANENLREFLKKNTLENARDFKEFLYQKSFHNFNDNIYKLVYDDSDKIIWEIEDIEVYEQLCLMETFKNGSEVISMWTNGKNFKFQFRFKQGFIFEQPNLRLKIASFKQ